VLANLNELSKLVVGLNSLLNSIEVVRLVYYDIFL